jgi:glycosyltransferase involved in cell wall biosynthesis
MQVNIVSEQPGWVCGWIGAQLHKHIDGSTMGEYVPNAANVYVPYYQAKPEKTARDIALFTHRSDNMGPVWDAVADMADVCVAMSTKTALTLPASKTTVIEVPVDPCFIKHRLVLGISGREYADGRKRLSMVADLAAIPGVRVHFSGGAVPWKEMPKWYAAIDYLVVLSDNEGGPMGVKEAMAMGKPVIAPDVGWCWDYPVIRYNDVDDLVGIVTRLAPRGDGWPHFAQQIAALC